ncbi:hypothetical protein [Neptunicella sp. SCSIO 80796]|uniref:hypothetical protein n=1 Tax=Neptunicella plasticusilytica TaxID=3117012 RepID=UPI003A4D3D85
MKLHWLLLTLVLFASHVVYADTNMDNNEAGYNKFSVRGLSYFNRQDAEKLKQWLTTGVNATRATLGVYPRPLVLQLYPRESIQPVPWAHTNRGKQESIQFYVTSRFPLESFINDWTIYHELSHLAIPYVGEEYSWFSEGFASFMQYQVMADKGILDGPPLQHYEDKLRPHLKWFDSQRPAAQIAQYLMSKKRYPAAYWSGAWFFVLADQQLQQKHHIKLTQLITDYQQCCRLQDDSIQDVISSFDKLIKDSLFNDLLNQFEQQPASRLYPHTLPDKNN